MLPDNTNLASDVVFEYDPNGHRVSKSVTEYKPDGSAFITHTFYVRDAGGNVLAVYESTEDKRTNTGVDLQTQQE